MKNNTLLSISDLEVNFKVRGKLLSAIRGISLDIYENEAIAIVGESGSGKSVLTKAISGMLDSNGYINSGEIVFHDDELAMVNVKLNRLNMHHINRIVKRLKSYCNNKLDDNILILSKEIWLSIERYGFIKRMILEYLLLKEFKRSIKAGIDIFNSKNKDIIFNRIVFRVRYLSENKKELQGKCKIDLTKIKYTKDWQQIRGSRIATIFQDPMTSLNPIVTIGNQITAIILKHQRCSVLEAKRRAVSLMEKVGIPNAEERFNDYPFQYSGGMRQRIVIAIALSCQPKILICDEPTTALDVTIQAQILKLIKDLQKEFHYTIIFITHDLGVVANIADRVAVLYAGQIVELGTVEDIFYDPKHPYTWALLSSLPQLAKKGDKLYYINGTPPSLYNRIVGDAFAPRNSYCLKIDTMIEPPMFKISDTHYAKTWLLDERAPRITKPELIDNLHEKLTKAYEI